LPGTDLRVKQLRTPRSRQGTGRLGRSWAGSVALHVLLLALLIFVRVATEPPPQEEPSIAVEFEPDKSQTPGGPNPSDARQTPNGPDSPRMRPTPNTQAQPDSQPQINIVPPEYQQMPPPPPQAEDAEPLPMQVPQPRYAHTSPRRRPQNSPFSHPMEFSYAPRDEHEPPAGLRNSRGLDLSAGPVVRGGRLVDSVAHVVGPGGRGDYLALLSEFIETHKYYPPEAARNGEDGSATVELTVRRDGKVEALNLVTSSGSELLDAAWMAVFRDNRLPPFPDDLTKPRETFMLTLNYQLIYGGLQH
jgi:TonB family protein